MIVLSNVCKTFDSAQGRVVAVDDVNLTVEAGQIYGIIGYSGAGKSTLIRLLNGLETPSSGSIQVEGFDIAGAEGNALRQARLKISMVFQHFNLLWSRTVSQNIAFSMQIAGVPKAQIKPRVAELVALVGLQGREDAYPSQLSGGQNSASASPARWPIIRGFYCAMKPLRRSTLKPQTRFSICCWTSIAS
jgi:D-methionine transport system ATP-binding protein